MKFGIKNLHYIGPNKPLEAINITSVKPGVKVGSNVCEILALIGTPLKRPNLSILGMQNYVSNLGEMSVSIYNV